jgi:mono/diheme cytochrome c family protein
MKRPLLAAIALACLARAQAQTPTPDGKALFAKTCAACHQASGLGIPGAFPALKGSRLVQGDANTLVTVVLKGRAGMPSFSATLNDDKLLLTLNYVRQAWGNQGAELQLQDVQAARQLLGDSAAVKKSDGPVNIH